MSVDQHLVDELKQFNWTKILEIANGLSDLNDAQLRFAKAIVIEKAVEKYSKKDDSDVGLVYVADRHKDYEWPKYRVSVELKSIVSSTFYTNKNKLRDKVTVKLNNSNGTNKKAVLVPSDVADILLVVKRDGVLVFDRKTVMGNSKSQGDGFLFSAPSESGTVIFDGSTTNIVPYIINFRKILFNAIEQSI